MVDNHNFTSCYPKLAARHKHSTWITKRERLITTYSALAAKSFIQSIITRIVKCEALPQNREQVTFWVKWGFVIIVRSIFSALIWYQNQVHTPPTFWEMTICAEDLKRLLWKCDFRKSAFKVYYFYSFGFNRLQKMQNCFVGKCLKICQKLHRSGRRHIKADKK